MDLSFDIMNQEGDHIMVALSYYDNESVSIFSSHEPSDYINHRVEIEDPENPDNRQYAHFICRKAHEVAVAKMGQMLMQK